MVFCTLSEILTSLNELITSNVTYVLQVAWSTWCFQVGFACTRNNEHEKPSSSNVAYVVFAPNAIFQRSSATLDGPDFHGHVVVNSSNVTYVVFAPNAIFQLSSATLDGPDFHGHVVVNSSNGTYVVFAPNAYEKPIHFPTVQ